MLKQFIVRKFIMAENAKQAIKKDKNTEVHDVWLDLEWQKMQPGCIVEGFKNRK